MASMFTTYSVFLLISSIFLITVNAKPERGQWIDEINKDHTLLWYVKSLYNNSKISIEVKCEGDTEVPMNINWVLRRSPCAQEYIGLNETYVTSYMHSPQAASSVYTSTEYLISSVRNVRCTKDRHFVLYPYNYTNPLIAGKGARQISEETVTTADDIDDIPSNDTRSKRQAGDEPQNPGAGRASKDDFLCVWEDGYYLLIMKFEHAEQGKPLPNDFNAVVTARMKWGNNNYISAGDQPLLIFYGVMGLVYIGYGLFWLIMLACNWKDLLRVQFWVGGVIFLGMLEKAVFFAEYENINKDGQPVRGAIILAELVSCIKRGLARMLVIIVCLGFGIIKPRLGQTLHKVLLAGTVFTVLASIEGCMRATKERPDQSTEWMFAAVPLAVTDAIICWWIFSALLQTTRTLRLRRNVVKLSLYRHFTNTLIFAIVASIAYMIWFLTQHRFKACITDWKELWVDEAFWHLLFSIILLIIMILWRPSGNNQRYAFSPLLDAAEDDLEDDDQVLSEAYEGMKMRTTKSENRKGPKSPTDAEAKLEDDLKWVEENIPSSLADKLLPALDSDEEIMNQKFEASKME